jgi:putative membrane protein
MIDRPGDLRIFQANERTFLAWIRTGLALMAFGFVLARISLWLGPGNPDDADMSRWYGIAFVTLGTICQPIAAVRFLRTRRAIIEQRDIAPLGKTATAIALAVALLGGLMIVYLATR